MPWQNRGRGLVDIATPDDRLVVAASGEWGMIVATPGDENAILDSEWAAT